MRLSWRGAVVPLTGGLVGAVWGFGLPLWVVLSHERGHELEEALSHRFDAVWGGDFLTVLLAVCSLGGACAGARLWVVLSRPPRPAPSACPPDAPEEGVWPPPPDQAGGVGR